MPRYPAAARALGRQKRVALKHFGWRPEYGQRWWLNFWRDGDPAAHRMAPVLENNGAVADVKFSGRDVNSVGEFIDVHGAYFKMRTVARQIAESFKLDPFQYSRSRERSTTSSQLSSKPS